MKGHRCEDAQKSTPAPYALRLARQPDHRRIHHITAFAQPIAQLIKPEPFTEPLQRAGRGINGKHIVMLLIRRLGAVIPLADCRILNAGHR